MRNRFGYRSRHSLLLLLLCVTLGMARPVAAEKVDLPPAELRRLATHVIVGKVLDIGQRIETEGEYRYVRYVARVKIRRVEKGSGLQPGAECDIHYWRRIRQPRQPPVTKGVVYRGSPDTSGHRGLPDTGDTLRIYLARNAYDGFTVHTMDGGFHVIGANGFEAPAVPKRATR